MTIRLHDIIPSYLSMSEEEKLTLVKHIRHMKYVEKPVVKAKKAKASAPRKKRAAKTAASLISNMTPEQKLALIAAMEGA